jgi:hypothetical protein
VLQERTRPVELSYGVEDEHAPAEVGRRKVEEVVRTGCRALLDLFPTVPVWDDDPEGFHRNDCDDVLVLLPLGDVARGGDDHRQGAEAGLRDDFGRGSDLGEAIGRDDLRLAAPGGRTTNSGWLGISANGTLSSRSPCLTGKSGSSSQ